MSASIQPMQVPSVGSDPDALRWFFGTLVHTKLRPEHTRGAFALAEHHAAHGDMPPLHLHQDDDEVFYVLDGTLELHVAGSEPLRLEAGGTALAPRGIAHTYRVVSEAGARWLLITSPGAFEGFVDEVAMPADAATPPPPPPGPPSPEQVAALTSAAERHGIEILGPPGTLPDGA